MPAPDTASVTASDTCGGTPVISFVGDSMSASNCVNQFTLTPSRRRHATCGRDWSSAVCFSDLDNLPPAISCPAAVTVACASAVPAPDTASEIGSASCRGRAEISLVGVSIKKSNCVNQFTLTRTYRATDACGNNQTCTQTITDNA